MDENLSFDRSRESNLKGRYYCVCVDINDCKCGYYQPTDPNTKEIIDKSIKKVIAEKKRLHNNKLVREHHKTPNGKKILAKAAHRYHQTKKGKAALKRASKKYMKSPKGKQKYEERKAWRREYYLKNKDKIRGYQLKRLAKLKEI